MFGIEEESTFLQGEIGESIPILLNGISKQNEPNRKMGYRILEVQVNDQKLYLSPIIDLFNGEVVSYNLSLHLISSKSRTWKMLFRSCPTK